MAVVDGDHGDHEVSAATCGGHCVVVAGEEDGGAVCFYGFMFVERVRGWCMWHHTEEAVHTEPSGKLGGGMAVVVAYADEDWEFWRVGHQQC